MTGSDQNPDPHYGLAPGWIRIRTGVKDWIQIRIRIETNADPKHWKKLWLATCKP
jgi:hypothetical protein